MHVTQSQTFDFHCYGCGQDAPLSDTAFHCAACNTPLSLVAHTEPDRALFSTPPQSQWTYSELLPIRDVNAVVSLGEGATPYIQAPAFAESHGLGEVTLKLEAANPTGSFKDRQVSVGISRARELGIDTVAVVSSGNVACAASAYAARAGMRAILLTHGFAAPNKVAQAASYGGKAIRVDSPSALAVFDLCIEACKQFGWYHLSTSGMHEPYNVEGAKTIAYELCQQTDGDLPDWIVAPVGGGGLLGGIWRGLLDLKRLGLIDSLPRLVGAQAAGCAPLTKAIDEGLSFNESIAEPWPNPDTIAGGIADDILFDGHTAIPAIRETNGLAIAVTDDEIIAAELGLARAEGILCEPSCAVAAAALKHLPAEARGQRVAVIVSGTGIKDLGILEPHVATPARIAPSLDELKEVTARESN
jgi:threonine synthase